METTFDREVEQVEQYLLGAMLVEPATIPQIVNAIGSNVEAFYTTGHQILFKGILDVFEKSKTVDPMMLADHLKRHNQLNRVGGAGYLYDLQAPVVEVESVPHYIDIIREKWQRRQLMRIGIEIRDAAGNPNIEIAENIALAQRKVVALSVEDESLHLKDHLLDAIDTISQRAQKGDGMVGIATGLSWLDLVTSGLQGGQLVILAARPGIGKTSLALNIGQHVSGVSQKPVLHFSLEMPSSELVLRMLSSTSRIPMMKLRSGKIPEDQWPLLMNTSTELQGLNMLINDNTSMNIDEMAAQARHLHNLHGGLGLIVVDYLQLVRGRNIKYGVREQEVADVTRSLKRLSGELDVPILACAQLSRITDRRPDKVPQLTDLRESGAIEQDADLVLMLHKDDEDAEVGSGGFVEQSLFLKKHRNGPTGTLMLRFYANIVKFEEVEA